MTFMPVDKIENLGIASELRVDRIHSTNILVGWGSDKLGLKCGGVAFIYHIPTTLENSELAEFYYTGGIIENPIIPALY